MESGNGRQIRWGVPHATAMSPLIGDLAVNNSSDWMMVQDRHVSFSLVWTGTPTGTLSIQCSNDKGTTIPVILVAADFSPAYTNPAGAGSLTAGQFTSDLLYFRIVYVAAGGAGTITGIAATKGA